jgi:hypothetical protein
MGKLLKTSLQDQWSGMVSSTFFGVHACKRELIAVLSLVEATVERTTPG